MTLFLFAFHSGYGLKVPWRIYYKLWPSWFTNVFMAWHRYTSPTNFTIQQSRSFEGVCVLLRLMSCLLPVPASQSTATELFQSPLLYLEQS